MSRAVLRGAALAHFVLAAVVAEITVYAAVVGAARAARNGLILTVYCAILGGFAWSRAGTMQPTEWFTCACGWTATRWTPYRAHFERQLVAHIQRCRG